MLHIDPTTLAAITPSAVLTAIEAHERAYDSYVLAAADTSTDHAVLREAERTAFHALVHTPIHNDAERVAYAVAVIVRENSPLRRPGEGQDRNDPLAVAIRNLSFGEHARDPDSGVEVAPLAGNARPAPAGPELSPALAAMMAEWTALDDKMGTTLRGGLTDAEMERYSDLHLAIYRFPAASFADLHAKLPVFRAEMGASEEYVVDGRNPKDVLCYASWLGVVTDLERLGGQARPTSTPFDPDPVFAAIGESREAMRRRNKAGALADRDARFESAWNTATDGSRRAWDTVLATRPTTLSGIQALARHVLDWCADQGDEGPETADLRTVLATIGDSILGVAPVAAPFEAPTATSVALDNCFAADLATYSIADLARLCEVLRATSDTVSATMHVPCFLGDNGWTPAGLILDAETTRLNRMVDACVGEIVRRVPASPRERDEVLSARLAHELACEGRIADPALMRDVINAWAPSRAPSRFRGTTRAAAQRAGR